MQDDAYIALPPKDKVRKKPKQRYIMSIFWRLSIISIISPFHPLVSDAFSHQKVLCLVRYHPFLNQIIPTRKIGLIRPHVAIATDQQFQGEESAEQRLHGPKALEIETKMAQVEEVDSSMDADFFWGLTWINGDSCVFFSMVIWPNMVIDLYGFIWIHADLTWFHHETWWFFSIHDETLWLNSANKGFLPWWMNGGFKMI